ncbi:MAG: hypothetical protein KC592_07200 [Nitrospira sp.]|nr:hypothetical protein [Nitrospira sp.]
MKRAQEQVAPTGASRKKTLYSPSPYPYHSLNANAGAGKILSFQQQYSPFKSEHTDNAKTMTTFPTYTT